MRRIAILMVLTLGLTLLTACTGVSWSDPLHPRTRCAGDCIIP
jgi:hypothetical protein